MSRAKTVKRASAKTAGVKRGLAVYAGTFDPITNGHFDIIQRATHVFDRLIVAVVKSSTKKTLLEADDRTALVQSALKPLPAAVQRKIEVHCFDGLLVDFARSAGARVIVRGLRAVSDYEYEAQMAIINRHLAEDIETVFLVTSDHCSFISSSVVREIAKNGGDISGLVPMVVARRLERVYKGS